MIPRSFLDMERGWPEGKRWLADRKYSEIVWLGAARTASTRHDAMVITVLPNTYGGPAPADPVAVREVGTAHQRPAHARVQRSGHPHHPDGR